MESSSRATEHITKDRRHVSSEWKRRMRREGDQQLWRMGEEEGEEEEGAGVLEGEEQGEEEEEEEDSEMRM